MRDNTPIILKIRNKSGGIPELLIYDEIGPDWAGMVSAISVKNALGSLVNDREILVRINSPGGDVFEGFAIYNALGSFPGVVNVAVDALAASAASVIAMAGRRIEMAANAMMMIHNCWVVTTGNAEALDKTAELCRKVDGQIIDTYAARSGQSSSTLADMMAQETWMTADEAVSLGLADGIGQPLNVSAALSPRLNFRNVPERFRDQVEQPRLTVQERLNEVRQRQIDNVERHVEHEERLAGLRAGTIRSHVSRQAPYWPDSWRK